MKDSHVTIIERELEQMRLQKTKRKTDDPPQLNDNGAEQKVLESFIESRMTSSSVGKNTLREKARERMRERLSAQLK
ncbi:hypothetical protein AKO1_012720 [Acrasis kona]|uniref:Uncharacterized protein n=1 Tax=Acrasis kona TaxID=1008807 RepID=A0AAW2YV97_9EUKA